MAAIQIVGVGLLLLLLSPDRLADPSAIMRTFGLGLVAAGLGGVVDRAWRFPKDPLVLSQPPARVRALQASGAVAFSFAVIAASRVLTVDEGSSPMPLLPWCVLSASIAAALQFAVPRTARVAIVGEPIQAARLQYRLETLGNANCVEVVAMLDARHDTFVDQLNALITAGTVANVVVPAGSDEAMLERLCTHLAGTTIRVLLTFGGDVAPKSPFAAVAPPAPASIPMLDLLPPPIAGWRRIAKRGFDVFFVLLFVPLLAPLLAMISVAIKVESAGPVLFRQWRFGQAGRPVLIYKFRTMRDDQADVTGAARTLARDPRVTRVGRVLRRLSLDELPQLLNVLRGDMSLVGPRPHPTHMKVDGVFYHEAVDAYRARHRMLPGITGWAQVNGSRGEVDTLEKAQRRVNLDLWYIANWSPLLDLWIILRTAFGGFATLGAD